MKEECTRASEDDRRPGRLLLDEDRPGMLRALIRPGKQEEPAMVVAHRRHLAREDDSEFAPCHATRNNASQNASPTLSRDDSEFAPCHATRDNASENASPALSRTSSGPKSPDQRVIHLLPSFADEKFGGHERRHGQGAIPTRHLHTPPPSLRISDESSYERTFLTPGDERTLRIQVRELEGEVASLAEQLHQSQEDLSRANSRNQQLRRTFEEEAEHARTLANGYEKQLKDDAVEAERKAYEIFDLKLKLADMQNAMCHKDLERASEMLEIRSQYAMQGWKACARESRRRTRVVLKRAMLKLMRRSVSCWRLASSPHVSLVRRYAHSSIPNLERSSPFVTAMVYAECGQHIVLRHTGWIPRACRKVTRLWRSLVLQRRQEAHKLEYIRSKFVRSLGTTMRSCFQEWHQYHVREKCLSFRTLNMTSRLKSHSKRHCFIFWKHHLQALCQLEGACNKFLHGFLRRFLGACMQEWHRFVYARLARRSLYQRQEMKLSLHRHYALVKRTFVRWVLSISLMIDETVAKLLDSNLCPLGGRLALAKAGRKAWQRLGRRRRQKQWRVMEIARKYRTDVSVAVFSRRALLFLRAWRLRARLGAYTRASLCRRSWKAWSDWKWRGKQAKHVEHIGRHIARRTQVLLMYDVMAEWYALLQLRFHQVVRVAKAYFAAWVTACRSHAAARESKVQAFAWVHHRSLALRTLLMWVLRGGRARSLHLARRWLSRAFHRWVSSTFRGRRSLPEALRRADAVLERLVFQ